MDCGEKVHSNILHIKTYCYISLTVILNCLKVLEALESNERAEGGLVASQRRILPLMFKSHRLLMAYIYYNLSIMYIWMGWVLLLFLWMDLPLPLLSIAFVIIALPILIAPMQYRIMKKNYSHLIDAKQILLDMQKTDNASQVIAGIAKYSTILFNVVSPNVETKGSSSAEHTKISIKRLRFNSVSKLAIQAFFVYLIFQSYFIPSIIELLEIGGLAAVLFNPVMMLMGIILAIMIVGLMIFVLWEIQVRRWVKIYHGFLAWGEEIERLIPSDLTEED